MKCSINYINGYMNNKIVGYGIIFIVALGLIALFIEFLHIDLWHLFCIGVIIATYAIVRLAIHLIRK
jgi:hypothetical protein